MIGDTQPFRGCRRVGGRSAATPGVHGKRSPASRPRVAESLNLAAELHGRSIRSWHAWVEVHDEDRAGHARSMAGGSFGTGWAVSTRVASGENDSFRPDTEGADCGVDRGEHSDRSAGFGEARSSHAVENVVVGPGHGHRADVTPFERCDHLL